MPLVLLSELVYIEQPWKLILCHVIWQITGNYNRLDVGLCDRTGHHTMAVIYNAAITFVGFVTTMVITYLLEDWLHVIDYKRDGVCADMYVHEWQHLVKCHEIHYITFPEQLMNMQLGTMILLPSLDFSSLYYLHCIYKNAAVLHKTIHIVCGQWPGAWLAPGHCVYLWWPYVYPWNWLCEIDVIIGVIQQCHMQACISRWLDEGV